MTFNVDKFNQGTVYDVRANLGNLKFLSLEKRPVFKDGQWTDEMEVTHAIVYSDKIGDNLQLKLAPGKTYEETAVYDRDPDYWRCFSFHL